MVRKPDTPTATAGTSIQTFLVADIRGYTHFTTQHGDEAGAALAARFADVVEVTCTAVGGRLIELRGDEALVAFDSARSAIRAALSLQDRFGELLAEDSNVPLLVGIGLDAGEAIPLRGGFRGGALNLAARLCSLAGPGEILASAGVVHLARHMDGIVFIDRQTVNLKGIDTPVRVFQAAREGQLAAELPPLSPEPPTPRPTLPDSPTPFIGREREIEDVTDMLLSDGTRLVTLTGPGGTGKTRLAVEVAGRVRPNFNDGVYLAAFAAVPRPDQVPAAIASALGVYQTSSRTLVDELHAHLRDRHLLLVLDNFEHLLEARTFIASLLENCRHLVALIASRSVLRLSREREYPVPPLSVPDASALHSLENLRRFDAIRLFLDRATAVNPHFRLTMDNAAAVVGICARLDGLPLALELAASRTRLFSPGALLSRLSSRLKVLTGGARDAPVRQQTLRGAIDWSHDLLETEEKALFARLSIFVGGFTVEAAEAVTSAPHTLVLDTLDGIGSLSEQSLVHALESASTESRFSMLETVREYAYERLAASDELGAIVQAHGVYFLSLAEAGETGLKGADQGEWLRRLEADHDNLRAALYQAIEQRNASLALRLTAALWYFWWTRGYLSEGRHWLDSALALPNGDLAERARALNGAANLAWSQGELVRARELHQQTLQFRRELGDRRGMGISLNNLAIVDEQAGNYAQAAEMYRQSLETIRLEGDDWSRALVLGNLGGVLLNLARYDEAADACAESLALWRTLGSSVCIARVLNNLAFIAMVQRDWRRAAIVQAESLALCRDIGNRENIATCLEGAGRVMAGQGNFEQAARLWAAADRLRVELEQPIPPAERAAHGSELAEARRAIDSSDFERASREGQSMTIEEASDYALKLLNE